MDKEIPSSIIEDSSLQKVQLLQARSIECVHIENRGDKFEYPLAKSSDFALPDGFEEEHTFFSPAVDKRDESDIRACLYSDQSGSLVFASSILAVRYGFKIKEKKWR